MIQLTELKSLLLHQASQAEINSMRASNFHSMIFDQQQAGAFISP